MMDYSMEIDHQTMRRKRCRDDDAADDFAQTAFPSAKKTRQFHFTSTDAADAFSSAFALAQAHPFQTSTSSSPQLYSSASSPNESGQSSPDPEVEDPFRAVMAVDSWGAQESSPMEEVQMQPQQYQQQHQQHSQPTLHTPPGRRGMIIAGWNQSRRNENIGTGFTIPLFDCFLHPANVRLPGTTLAMSALYYSFHLVYFLPCGGTPSVFGLQSCRVKKMETAFSFPIGRISWISRFGRSSPFVNTSPV
ncbi:hypothetical protein V8F33_005038 [Rhypophila sp. PSN 637]